MKTDRIVILKDQKLLSLIASANKTRDSPDILNANIHTNRFIL